MVKLSAFLFVVISVSLVSVGACSKSPAVQMDNSIASSTLKQVVLEVATITCASCFYRVKASAKSVSGVIDVRLDRKNNQRVIIVYDPAQTNSSAIIIAIEKNGDKVIELHQ